jgi:hypothetical protein
MLGPRQRSKPHHVGEQVDLVGIGGGREEDQLIAAGRLVGRDFALDRLRILGRAGDEELGDLLAEPAVVVGQVGTRLLLGAIAKGEVGERHRPWLPLATGLRPGGPGLLGAGAELLRPGGRGDPARGEAGGTGKGRVGVAADDQTRSLLHRGAYLVAGPDLLEPLQHRVELAPAAARREIAGLVVVVATAEADAEREATVGDCLQAEHLLGELGCVGAKRPEQDRGAETDPLGHGSRRGQRRQRLVVLVDDAVDRAEAGEASGLSSPRPLGQLLARRPRHRVGQPDRNVHSPYSFARLWDGQPYANGFSILIPAKRRKSRSRV